MTSTTTPLPNLGDLDQLQQLTERYARYRNSAGGLSSVLGGLLSLVMFFTALLVPLATVERSVLALAPLLWLLSKEALRRFYYQRSGAVGEKLSASQHRQHVWLTLFVAAVSTAIVAAGLWKFGVGGLLTLPWPKLSYFLIAVLMPLIVWRWLWSSSDFIAGVCLMCQAAVIIAGSNYRLDFLGVYLIAMALLCIFYGVREHRDYLSLRSELQQVRQRLQGNAHE